MENKENQQSKDQEVVEVNPVTERILKRYGYKDSPATQEGEQTGDEESTEEAPADPDTQQVNDETQQEDLEYTDEEINSLLDKGINPEDLEGKTPAEIKELIKGDDKQQATAQERVIITEAMASKYGFAKSLVGKPVDELFKAIDNQNRLITKLQQQQSQAKASTETKQQNNQQEDDQTLEEELTEADIVNMKPKEQAEYIAKIVAREVAKGKKKEEPVKTEQSNEEVDFSKLSPEQQQEMYDEYNKAFFTALQTKLPEGIKAETVFNEWKAKANLSDDMKVALAKNPDFLITTVVEAYTKQNPPQKKTEVNSEVRKQNFAKVKKAFELMKQGGNGTKFNFPREGKVESNSVFSEEGSDEETLMGKIIRRNLPQK